jgi:hypothetical protein
VFELPEESSPSLQAVTIAAKPSIRTIRKNFEIVLESISSKLSVWMNPYVLRLRQL